MFDYCDEHKIRHHTQLGCPACGAMGGDVELGDSRFMYTTLDQNIEVVNDEGTKKGGGVKHDDNKLRIDLFPFRSMLKVSQVMQFGAMKYDERNWEKGMDYHRLWRGAVSHMLKWFYGQDKDPETGITHLAHAMCCIAFLLEYEDTHPECDDRPKLPPDQIDAFVDLFDFKLTPEMQEYFDAREGR